MVVVYFSLVLLCWIKREKGALMTTVTTTITNSNYDIRCSSELVVKIVVVTSFGFILLVFAMERGENFNAKAWKRMVLTRQFLLDQIPTK